MADEISIKLQMSFKKGLMQKVSINPAAFTIDVAGTDYIYATQSIATSATAIDKGDITTPGYMLVHNMDATNFVEIGYDDTGFKPTIKLLGAAAIGNQEWALFRCTQATPQAKADTSACVIEYLMIEA